VEPGSSSTAVIEILQIEILSIMPYVPRTGPDARLGCRVNPPTCIS
jgi:hypothetical protein